MATIRVNKGRRGLRRHAVTAVEDCVQCVRCKGLWPPASMNGIVCADEKACDQNREEWQP